MQSKSLVDAAFEHAAAIPSSAEHGPASRAAVATKAAPLRPTIAGVEVIAPAPSRRFTVSAICSCDLERCNRQLAGASEGGRGRLTKPKGYT